MFLLWRMTLAHLVSRGSQAIFTYAQMLGADATGRLQELCKDPSIREFVLRAMADRKASLTKLSVEPFFDGLER